MSYCIFDAHCDTISELLDKNKNLFSNDLNVDLKRALGVCENNTYIQFFAAFAEGKNAAERVFLLIDKYYREIEKNSEIIHCESFLDIESNMGKGRVLSLLSIEGGDSVISLEMLRIFYRLGVRMLTLTWNYSNTISDGICEERGAGLTTFGKALVKEMNKIGMAIDVSHLSERGFFDVAQISDKPFVASHSNAKAVYSHPRNLTDEQIKTIISKNGCIGINFYTEFLTNKNKCTISDIICHIEHILALGGENNIGFGSDFDGMDSLPEKLCGIEDIFKITDELLKLNYSEALVKKICSENFLRTLKSIFTN